MSEMVERVAEKLRAECLAVFGSTWNNDVAARFARAAIDTMREPTEAMALVYADPQEATMYWQAMIDTALK